MYRKQIRIRYVNIFSFPRCSSNKDTKSVAQSFFSNVRSAINLIVVVFYTELIVFVFLIGDLDTEPF